MNHLFGMEGRVEITIKRANGRVDKQVIYNALVDDVYEQLANRITSNTLAYDSLYSPARIKIYAKGHDGGGGSPVADEEWFTNWLDHEDVSAGAAITSGTAGSKRFASITYTKRDLKFDGDVTSEGVAIPGSNNFPGTIRSGQQIRAHIDHTRIVKVELADQSDTAAIGTASIVGESGAGAGDLTGQAGEGHEIDANDLVTIQYIITITGDTSTSEAYVDRLARTLRDGATASATTPNVAFSKIKLYHTVALAGGGDDSRNSEQELVHGTHTHHVNVDSLNKSVIYLGEPDMSGTQINASPYNGALKNPATFTAIETKTGTVPTKVEALTSDPFLTTLLLGLTT